MKSIFKTCLFFSLIFIGTNAISRDVILIENLATKAEAELLVSILTKKFKFPRELITVKNIKQDCEIRSDAIVHLCLLANGELNVKKIDHYVVKNSLGIFLNQEEEGDKKGARQ